MYTKEKKLHIKKVSSYVPFSKELSHSAFENVTLKVLF